MALFDEKNKVFDALLADYEKEFQSFSTQIKRQLSEFIQGGPYTKTEVTTWFIEQNGMDALAQGFVDKYSDVLDYTRQVSREAGIKFVLPQRSADIIGLYQQNQVSNILGSSEEIIKTVTDASLRYGIGEQRLNTIIADLERTVDTVGRRMVTEAFTGASVYDRTVKFEQFQNAGIELYFYSGPLDDVTRDVCVATLSDPLQATGWTLAQIQDSGTPFGSGGGYNCRHEWLPFVPGLDDLIKDMQKDAGIPANLPDDSGAFGKSFKTKKIPERRKIDRERRADEKKAQKDFKREIAKQDKEIVSLKRQIAETKRKLKSLGG